mgnify:CR=1 FL=1
MINEKYDWLGLVMLLLVGISVGMTMGFSNRTIQKDEAIYFRVYLIEKQMENQRRREVKLTLPITNPNTNQVQEYQFFVLKNEVPFGL